MQGSLIKRVILSGKKQNQIIAVEDLVNGVYIAELLQNGSIIESKKLSIQH